MEKVLFCVFRAKFVCATHFLSDNFSVLITSQMSDSVCGVPDAAICWPWLQTYWHSGTDYRSKKEKGKKYILQVTYQILVYSDKKGHQKRTEISKAHKYLQFCIAASFINMLSSSNHFILKTTKNFSAFSKAPSYVEMGFFF